ncbi:MAG: DUF1016 N-terminal domain-containing protein [Clostridiales bacterium]|nr:DUF1016 N-terminal domain-containing protein [Clostridiales bacterium]
MDDITIYSEAVKEIRNAILQSRYRVARVGNRELLSLYYNVGQYVSENSRAGKWGTGAIETISDRLQTELPGVRGFSPMNIKNMRTFYEQWAPELESIRQLATVELENDKENNESEIRGSRFQKPRKHNGCGVFTFYSYRP